MSSSRGHRKRDCPNVIRCGLNGRNSNEHSRYLHEDGQQPHNETNQPKTTPRTTSETRQVIKIKQQPRPEQIQPD
jgi:hypothetical protein